MSVCVCVPVVQACVRAHMHSCNATQYEMRARNNVVQEVAPHEAWAIASSGRTLAGDAGLGNKREGCTQRRGKGDTIILLFDILLLSPSW
jgi:hypothetical protein